MGSEVVFVHGEPPDVPDHVLAERVGRLRIDEAGHRVQDHPRVMSVLAEHRDA